MSLSIGLFVPNSIPPQRGGLERFAMGLERVLNGIGNCTLVQVPVDERTFEGIQRGYKRFYEQDTSPFDVVISCKAPSFLIQHPNHINYLNHRIRVFYDLYESEGREKEGQRKLIHQMDAAALDPSKIKKQFVVGKTVQQRLKKWGNLESQVLYHPTTLENLNPGKYDYFLFTSRFHRWKRGYLVIKAYLEAKVEIPLIMVGKGEDEREWMDLAQGNENIIFKGEVSDSELASLYSDALAVIFPPVKEDFGLITIESFLSKTPIITCTDSGETLEFVTDQKTGLVAQPTVQSLAQKIKFCQENKKLAPEWGKAGYYAVKKITWENVIDNLIGDMKIETPKPLVAKDPPQTEVLIEPKKPNVPKKKNFSSQIKILVSDNQVLTPPVGGGRVRISYLYRNFSKEYFVNYLGMYDNPAPEFDFTSKEIKFNFIENLVPMTSLQWYYQQQEQAQYPNHLTADTLFSRMVDYSPKFQRTIEELSNEASVHIASHPWAEKFFQPEDKKVLVYDSHNCETLIKKELFKNVPGGHSLIKETQKIEKSICGKADLIFVCSNDDGLNLKKIFKIPAEKLKLIPNGVDTFSIKPSTQAEKTFARNELGIDTPHTALFMGSAYGPNTQAVEFIQEQLLHKHPEVTFLVLGGVRDSYYTLKKGSTPLPSISKTGLGEGWFEVEPWEGDRKVRWTQKGAYIGIMTKEEGILNFEGLANQKKKLGVEINGKASTSIKISPNIWKNYAIPLKGKGPFIIKLEISHLNQAAQTDPREVGLAISEMSFTRPGRTNPISMEVESGNDALGDRFSLLGVVSEEVKKTAFTAADVALNPIFIGSGSNIKMFEYLAAGLPTITTSLGARGVDGASGNQFIVSSKNDFSETLENLLYNKILKDNLSKAGRKLAVDKYDWRNIAKKAEDEIQKVMIKKGII